jgi:hypothetical protein
MDFAKRIIGSEVVLDAPDGTPRWWGSCESSVHLEILLILWNLSSFRLEIVLVPVQDICTVYAKRTISLEIILDAPDGTPRYW